MLVKTTRDQVVGTVHLVTDENLFVAKTSLHPVEKKSNHLQNWTNVCFHARTRALRDGRYSRMFSQCIQTHKHADKSTCLNRHHGHSVWTTCKHMEVELQSWAASAVLLPHIQGFFVDSEPTQTPRRCSGKLEAWRKSEELSVQSGGMSLLYGHLLSIRDWTLCTSSRAIFKICWTS